MHTIRGLLVRFIDPIGALTDRLARGGPRDRGDVPGWVMVTVMSAILVVAILGVFEPEIKAAITNAINSVSNSK